MKNILEPNQTISQEAITIWKRQYIISHISTLLLLCSLLLVAHYFNWYLWSIIALYISIVIMVVKTIYMTTIYPSLLQKSWRYQIDEVFIQEWHGVFHLHHTVIPTDKVQAVHISNYPRLKEFGLANLIIQAKTTTIHIPAIPLSEAERLKNKMETCPRNHTTDGVEQRARTNPTVYYHQSWKNITLLFMTSLYTSLLLILSLLIYIKLNQLFLFETFTTTLFYTMSWSRITIGTITLFFIVCIISALYHYFTFGTYKIAADNTYLYLNKNGMSIPIHKNKIKGILVETPWFKKPFHLARAKFVHKESIERNLSEKIDVLFPFISVQEVYAKIEELLPNQQMVQETSKNTLSNEAYFAEFIQPNYSLVIITFLFMFFWPEYWFVLVVYALYIIIKKILKVRQQQYSLASHSIHVKTGSLSSTTWTFKQDVIDAITFDQTWIQRKLGLVSIIITSKTDPVYTVQLEHVQKDIALDIYDWYTNT